MSTVVLLSSPFLGPAVWAPVAQLLQEQGLRVRTPGWTAPVQTPADVLDQVLAQLPAGEELVLVPHSNAGLYVAALAAARPVGALVFVDALLPSADPTTATAAPTFAEVVRAMVEPDGLLPPWTRWWPSDEVDLLFPDAATRVRVEAEQQRLPPGYVEEHVPTPAGWELLPAAYVGFGDTYADEQQEAARRGWPGETLPGRHLHQLVDPAAVTGVVLRLLAVTEITSTADVAGASPD